MEGILLFVSFYIFGLTVGIILIKVDFKNIKFITFTVYIFNEMIFKMFPN